MLGQKNAIRPKAIAASPRSSNSHQFSASSLSKAEATRDMRGPDSTWVLDIVLLLKFGIPLSERSGCRRSGRSRLR
jgi:hypothetical protein